MKMTLPPTARLGGGERHALPRRGPSPPVRYDRSRARLECLDRVWSLATEGWDEILANTANRQCYFKSYGALARHLSTGTSLSFMLENVYHFCSPRERRAGPAGRGVPAGPPPGRRRRAARARGAADQRRGQRRPAFRGEKGVSLSLVHPLFHTKID